MVVMTWVINDGDDDSVMVVVIVELVDAGSCNVNDSCNVNGTVNGSTWIISIKLNSS